MASSLAKGPVDDPDVGDHAAVLVELGVEDQRARRCVELALGRGHLRNDRLQQLGHTLAGLGGDADHALRVDADQLGDLPGHALGLRAREVDLVHRGDQLEARVDGQVGVRDGLGLDPLRGVHEQQRPVARGQRARHLVREVHVARRVDQVQPVELAVARLVLHAHGLGLDRDAPLALQLHRVEQLRAMVARVDRPRDLEDPVGERGLPVIDVGDDREVADVGCGRCHCGVRVWR